MKVPVGAYLLYSVIVKTSRTFVRSSSDSSLRRMAVSGLLLIAGAGARLIYLITSLPLPHCRHVNKHIYIYFLLIFGLTIIMANSAESS